MKVLFLTKYDYLGASSRYRTLKYLPYLQEKGIEYKVSPLFSNKYLEYKYNNKKTCKIEVVKAFIKRILLIKALRRIIQVKILIENN